MLKEKDPTLTILMGGPEVSYDLIFGSQDVLSTTSSTVKENYLSVN